MEDLVWTDDDMDHFLHTVASLETHNNAGPPPVPMAPPHPFPLMHFGRGPAGATTARKHRYIHNCFFFEWL